MREQAQVDEGMVALEGFQPRQQPADGEGSHGADGDALAVAAALELLQHGGDAFEGIREHGQQGLAFVGQREAARQPAEQPRAQATFEVLHLGGDGRLRDVQFQAGACC